MTPLQVWWIPCNGTSHVLQCHASYCQWINLRYIITMTKWSRHARTATRAIAIAHTWNSTEHVTQWGPTYSGAWTNCEKICYELVILDFCIFSLIGWCSKKDFWNLWEISHRHRCSENFREFFSRWIFFSMQFFSPKIWKCVCFFEKSPNSIRIFQKSLYEHSYWITILRGG